MIDLLLDHAAAILLGLETADGLPQIAAEAMALGADSPSLRVLVAMDAPRREEAMPILERAIKELGASIPNRRAAAIRLAKKTAQEILRGEISAYDGSKHIWGLARQVTEESVSDLEPFIYAASEWEERPEDRRLEDGMLRAARELIARTADSL